MTSLADRTIAALRAEHDATATLARDLTDEQLTGPSGADAWTVANVLSHLGSGAVITLVGLRSALGAPAPEDGFNQSVRLGRVERDEPDRAARRLARTRRGAGRGLRGARRAAA